METRRAMSLTSTTSAGASAKMPTPRGVEGSSKIKGLPKAGPFAKSMLTPSVGVPGITDRRQRELAYRFVALARFFDG